MAMAMPEADGSGVKCVPVNLVPSGVTMTLQDVPSAAAIGEVKELIARDARFPPPEDQDLLLDGQRLDDATPLSDLPMHFTVLFVVNSGIARRARQAQAVANHEAQGEQLAGAPAPGTELAAAAAAAAVAEGGADGAADGAAADGAVDGGAAAPAAALGPLVGFNFSTFTSTVFVKVPLHASFGHIKARYLAPAVDMLAKTIKLIYVGHELDDLTSPFQQNCIGGSRINVVRTHDEGLLQQTITQKDLVGNCRFCQTRGTKFLFRPQCGGCGSQSIVDPTLTVTPGETRWRDLGGHTCSCYGCAAPVERGFPTPVERPLAFGIFCDNRHIDGAPRCPTRQLRDDAALQLFRKRLTVCTGDNTVAVANQLYGYAHAAGLLM